MKSYRCALVVLLLVAPYGEAREQSGSDARVQRLEEAVHVLERRVAALEAQIGEPSRPANGAHDNANWRNLKRGMSEAEVERLLGSPSNVSESEYDIMWRYYDPSLGYLVFDAKSRKLTRWSEP